MSILLARILLILSSLTMALASFFLWHKTEPFYSHYFLFAWWSYIGIAESWLYIKSGDSLLIIKPGKFFLFLVPLSAFVWFIFEAFNLRIQNWYYVNVPAG